MEEALKTLKREDLSEDLNVASYFLIIEVAEKKDRYYLALILDKDEKSEKYEEIISKLAKRLFSQLLMEEVEPDYLSFLLESYIEILQIEIMRYKAKNTANENLIQQLKTEIDEYRIKLEEIKNQVAIPDDVVEGSLEDKYFKLRNEMTKLKAQLRTKE